MEQMILEGIGLFFLISGLIVGLGSVTVIDLHGFLARNSGYWTEATIRTHKITKPLIWLGITLFVTGSFLYAGETVFTGFHLLQLVLSMLLILNGLFLTFVISPYLLNLEKKGKQTTLLPQAMQRNIIISFLVSFAGWWSQVILLVWKITIS